MQMQTCLLSLFLLGLFPGFSLASDGWPASPRDPDGWPASSPQTAGAAVASCEYVNGFCLISISDPMARRIPANQVLQNGPRSGLVTPQAYADAWAGRSVSITRMSFVPSRRGMRALIEWQ